MTQDLFPQSWLVNTLLDEGFIAQKRAELATQPIPYDLSAWLNQHFDAPSLSQRSEAQLEERFIGPLLTHLLRSFKGMATKRPEYLALLQ